MSSFCLFGKLKYLNHIFISILSSSSDIHDLSIYFSLNLLIYLQVLETILSREQVELERQLREEEQEPEAVFIREALMLLQERRDKVRRRFKRFKVF